MPINYDEEEIIQLDVNYLEVSLVETIEYIHREIGDYLNKDNYLEITVNPKHYDKVKTLTYYNVIADEDLPEDVVSYVVWFEQ